MSLRIFIVNRYITLIYAKHWYKCFFALIDLILNITLWDMQLLFPFNRLYISYKAIVSCFSLGWEGIDHTNKEPRYWRQTAQKQTLQRSSAVVPLSPSGLPESDSLGKTRKWTRMVFTTTTMTMFVGDFFLYRWPTYYLFYCYSKTY